MGLYGSKDQHPKLANTESENKYLESIEWIKCKHCGNTHLKQYKECPYCSYRRKQPKRWKTVLLVAVIAVVALAAVFGESEPDNEVIASSVTTHTPEKIPTLSEQLEALGGDPIYIATDVSILTQCGISSLRNAVLINNSKEPDRIANYSVSYGDLGELYITFKNGSLTNLTFAGTLLYNAATGIEANINDVIDQSNRAKQEPNTIKAPAETTEAKPKVTTGQKNALRAAKLYLDTMPFSYDGLIRQLEFSKYTHEDAVYAADNCGADWSIQASKKAKSYLDIMPFSRDGLIQQLEFEGFTRDQAEYAAKQNGY